MTTDARSAQLELGQRLRQLRRAAGLTQRELAERVGYSRARVAGAESGEGCAALFWSGCDKVLNGGGVLLTGHQAIEEARRRRDIERKAAERAERARTAHEHEDPSRVFGITQVPGDMGPEVSRRVVLPGGVALAAEDSSRADPDLLDSAETVRRDVEDTLARGTVSPSRLDRLGETLATHIRLYTATAPARALSGLLIDFTDVRRIAAHRQPAMVQARLSEIMALLGTLVADALMKLGRVHDARSWYGTSRIAADDAGNPELRARVRAQEAMLPYYYGHPGEAVRLAREGQDILGDQPRAAGALATAAEARARARLGDHTGARQAMARAETLTAAVDEPDSDEAFRFGARRFLFYASGTYSNLGDTIRATRAQTQALALYGTEAGPIDPALIHLDQAQILITEGDIESAGQLTEETLLTIPTEQRTLIFGTRLTQIIALTPSGNRAHRKLVDLRQQLAIEAAEGPSATSR